jgi:hypothetical protein
MVAFGGHAAGLLGFALCSCGGSRGEGRRFVMVLEPAAARWGDAPDNGWPAASVTRAPRSEGDTSGSTDGLTSWADRSPAVIAVHRNHTTLPSLT